MRRFTTRREFLAATSLAAAGTMFATPRRLEAYANMVMPGGSPLPPDAVLPAPSVADLRALAARAVDAAKSAGASYADIRIGERHFVEPRGNRVTLRMECTYGVRAFVDGVSGFSYGRLLTADGVTRCAQDAVRSARFGASVSTTTGRNPEWVPAPVVTGEWKTPVKIDPFSVPIEQHVEQLNALNWTVGRLPQAGGRGGFRLIWVRESRVFAATTGSMVAQQLHRAEIDSYGPEVQYGENRVSFRVPGLTSGAVGYELLTDPGLHDRIKAAEEEAILLTRLPIGPIDVGRYPVVFDGHVMGKLLIHMIGPALELDRVLGDEAEGSGTSCFSLDSLGSRVGATPLTITGHRSTPSVTAVKWDDDGAIPQEHVAIRDGILTDFHTSGQNVSTMQSWYQRQGQPLRSNGCAKAGKAEESVVVVPPHLTMTAASTPTSLQDLYKDMPRGIVAINWAWILPSQQLRSGSLGENAMLFEVSHGKLVRRIRNMAVQFNTLPFLKGLLAVGDATTVREEHDEISKGVPWRGTRRGATAPAALFKEVNVFSMESGL